MEQLGDSFNNDYFRATSDDAEKAQSNFSEENTFEEISEQDLVVIYGATVLAVFPLNQFLPRN